MTVDTAELLEVGRAAGLDVVGVTSAEVFGETRRHLLERRAAGLHAGMQFTYRNPERSTDAARAVPGARSIAVGARSYRRRPPPRPAGPTGRVAGYSWHDHYAELRAALDAMADVLAADRWRVKVLADDNALVDREAARRAGLGWYGKNTVLLLPGRGSWFVLGSVVTDAPLDPSGPPPADGCGTCTRCLSACPTGALVAPGVLDARRCLAWLLQAPGSFPREHRQALGDRIYGCDECQEVCPPNRREDRRRPAPEAAAGDEPWVDLVRMLEAGDAELLSWLGRWYIPRRDPRYLRRNALVALGNSGEGSDPRVERVLMSALASDDALLREHAVWAAGRLGRRDLLGGLAEGEQSPAVRSELAAAGALT